ncbi:MAG: hypothetical protein RL621_1617 [Bacteroidota bacterium]|jgi:hypothetical protein
MNELSNKELEEKDSEELKEIILGDKYSRKTRENAWKAAVARIEWQVSSYTASRIRDIEP